MKDNENGPLYGLMDRMDTLAPGDREGMVIWSSVTSRVCAVDPRIREDIMANAREYLRRIRASEECDPLAFALEIAADDKAVRRFNAALAAADAMSADLLP